MFDFESFHRIVNSELLVIYWNLLNQFISFLLSKKIVQNDENFSAIISGDHQFAGLLRTH